jgi:ubiquinone/menaquinone biosynthesis C-methylase UbiE
MIAARALISACTLGIFDALAPGPDDAAGLAARLDLDELGVQTIADALRSLGYLEQDDAGRLRLAPVAERLLAHGSPESIAAFVGAQNAHHWDTLGRLDEVVRSGQPVGWHDAHPGDALWEAYVRGLFEVSRGEHDANAALVPCEEPGTLLDVAGGHGAFAMAMCRRHPTLRATVLDLPASAAVGRRIVAEQGYADRVAFREGDALAAELGEGLDVISAFNLVHHLSPRDNEALLARSRAALAAGGCLVIGETERPEPGRPVHQMGALSGLLFYAMSRARTYTRAEMAGWLERAGFAAVDVHRNERSPWRIVLVART